jgi:serine/threonine-protein kinase
MAEIYRALITTPDGAAHDVAIKRLLPRYNEDEDFITMLADEARITAQLAHANIAQVYEFGVVDGQHVLAMEFIDGVDLRSLLRRCRERDQPIAPTLAARIVEQALRGLHFAHERRDPDGQPLKIVHRDFSPSNILIGYDGSVKLIDFGIAKARHNRTLTRGGIIKGKVTYMSPEQTMGKRLDARSDVFAAGVVLYSALCGQQPFFAPTDAELMVAIREQEPDPPSRQVSLLDPAMDAILMRAIRKDPDARYASAEAFADALDGWIQSRESDVDAGRLGRLISRVFARERLEAAEHASGLIIGDDPEPTDSVARRQYTRLVDVGHFTLGAPVEDPHAEVDAWLTRRRYDEESDDDFWSSDQQPSWAEESIETSEMPVLRTAEHRSDGTTRTTPFEPDETTRRR